MAPLPRYMEPLPPVYCAALAASYSLPGVQSAEDVMRAALCITLAHQGTIPHCVLEVQETPEPLRVSVGPQIAAGSAGPRCVIAVSRADSAEPMARLLPEALAGVLARELHSRLGLRCQHRKGSREVVISRPGTCDSSERDDSPERDGVLTWLCAPGSGMPIELWSEHLEESGYVEIDQKLKRIRETLSPLGFTVQACIE